MNPNSLMNLFCPARTGKIYVVLFAGCTLLSIGRIAAQQTVVLPGNGSYIQKNAPQGGLRSQRAFYLMTPKEVQASGLTNGAIGSIGFTIGAAQDSTTRGSFNVYLQNTTDTVSR